MTRHVFMRPSVATAVALIFCLGCVTAGSQQRRAPTFDYAPPGAARPGSSNITFAVVGARYGANIPLCSRWSM